MNKKQTGTRRLVTRHNPFDKTDTTLTRSMNNNSPEFFTLFALVNNRQIRFIIDSCSPGPSIPKSQFNTFKTKITLYSLLYYISYIYYYIILSYIVTHALETKYRDVNDNRIKFFKGKTMAKVNIDKKQKRLEILFTTRKTKPLLCLDWMKIFGITLDTGKSNSQINHVKEDPDETTLKRSFKKLLNENHTVKGVEVKIQLEEDANSMQQRGKTNTDSFTTIG